MGHPWVGLEVWGVDLRLSMCLCLVVGVSGMNDVV